MMNQNTTTQNALKKELLSINPKTFKFLHDFHGFDGQSPYFIFKIEGRFTHKQIMKQIPAEMGEDFSASLFLIRERFMERSIFYHVMIGETGFHIPHNTAHYKNDMDYFWAKTAFEEVRKNETKYIFVVVQKREYTKPRKTRPQLIDGERYIISDRGIIKGSHNGRGYISQMYLKPKTGNGEEIYLQPNRVIYSGQKLSDNIHDYIDKSGYWIYKKREELQQRARKLKAEREKIAVMNTDFTERKKAIRAKLVEIREMLSRSALTATTYKSAGKLDSITRRYMWLVLDAERMETADFRNLEQANKTFEHIENKISEILTEGANNA